MGDERKSEDGVRELTKPVYGDNYDHSQCETTLNCIHDFDNFFGNLCLNNFIKLMESLCTLLDDYNESRKQE